MKLFVKARKYYGHLATLRPNESEIWLCVTICSALANELVEAITALRKVEELLIDYEFDVRVKFCEGNKEQNIITL